MNTALSLPPKMDSMGPTPEISTLMVMDLLTARSTGVGLSTQPILTAIT